MRHTAAHPKVNSNVKNSVSIPSAIIFFKTMLLILLIFTLPSCMGLLITQYADIRFPHVTSHIEPIEENIDYIKIAKNFGQKNGFDIIPYASWRPMTGLKKAHKGGVLMITIGKEKEQNRLFVDIKQFNNKLNREEILADSNEVMKDFKEKYMAEIEKAKKSEI